jgi:protein gp37
MGDKTGIEWTDATWNPVAGCSLVSPGCTNCYAMRMAHRIEAIDRATGRKGSHYEGTTKTVKGKPVWTGKLALAPDNILTQPLRWKRPRRIFVNSMSDPFHEAVPDEWIDRIFSVMLLCPQHTFQILTKRPLRMHDYMKELVAEQRAPNRFFRELLKPLVRKKGDSANIWNARLDDACQTAHTRVPWGSIGGKDVAPRNVWLGVSVEDQARADERIPLLLRTPAAIRFISAEPLISALNLSALPLAEPDAFGVFRTVNALTGNFGHGSHLGYTQTTEHGAKLDWVIAGGESGTGARPMHHDWICQLRDQCKEAGVPFFFKQWGEFLPYDLTGIYDLPELAKITRISLNGRMREAHDWGDGNLSVRVGKRALGRQLQGRLHSEFPQVPA